MVCKSLIIVIILLIAAWIWEKRENIVLLHETKRCKSKLIEERKWSDKMCSERNDAIKKYIELEKARCDGAFSSWTLITDEDNVYLEKDNIRLVFKDRKCIGWYHPNGDGFKNP